MTLNWIKSATINERKSTLKPVKDYLLIPIDG